MALPLCNCEGASAGRRRRLVLLLIAGAAAGDAIPVIIWQWQALIWTGQQRVY